ncbi:CHASE2 domain-containing protein [Nostoc sp. TCL26-01]|nr:CHASE2 domain-containing protein [Nostoc sp. TCL26-01]
MPGFLILTIVIIARLSGWLQVFEWMMLDTFLRYRPDEKPDDQVVIIGVNDQDIRSMESYPISDKNLAQLIKTLQKYQPVAIGLDIVRDIPVPPGYPELVNVFQTNKNLIAIEKILPPDEIFPPAALPSTQVGFSDIIPDEDGKYRRYLLWTPSSKNPQNYDEAKYSLSLRLAIAYLAAQGINIETGKNDQETIRFNHVEISRFTSNFGGYVGGNDTGLKTLVNFRSGKEPFRVLSFTDIKNSNFNPQWLQGKIVLIGITAASVPDVVNSGVIAQTKLPGEISGVEFHAHVCSQIIQAVISGRSQLKSWSETCEYLWIILWGFVPMIIGRMTQSATKNLFLMALVICGLLSIAYLFILFGWWIPVAPNLLILSLNAMGISAFAFYQHDQAQKSKINERQYAIEQAFNIIHNGPLQTLANVLRQMRTQGLSDEELISQLEKLNYEIRAIGEYLKLKALSPDESLRLGSRLKLDLKRPIHELFYEVYTSTLERDDLAYFPGIKVKVRAFEPIDDKYLNLEIKRELCLFLEEALCNVGKHAAGVKRIEAIGSHERGYYQLRIKDNGAGILSFVENKGTKQLKNITRKLGGDFRRESISPQGTLCEITWKLKSSKLQIFSKE